MLNKRHSIILSLCAFILLSLTSTQLLACTRPSAPVLPDAATAVTPQMIKAKNDVKAYVKEAKAFLDCTKSTKKHNKMVDEMNKVAGEFNNIVRAYKARLAG